MAPRIFRPFDQDDSWFLYEVDTQSFENRQMFESGNYGRYLGGEIYASDSLATVKAMVEQRAESDGLVLSEFIKDLDRTSCVEGRYIGEHSDGSIRQITISETEGIDGIVLGNDVQPVNK